METGVKLDVDQRTALFLLVEETIESFDPAGVVRSKQTSSETSPAGLGSNAGGVAGARANQPPALSTSTAATAPASSAIEVVASGAIGKIPEASEPSAAITAAAASST